MNTELFDTVAVNIKTKKVRIFGRNNDQRNADAIIRMAVMRRGVDEEFYVNTKTGKYNVGDDYKYKGN